ncbi:MAG: VRR-NUC domain-containing protein [Eubacteriales bacterium]
MRSYEEAEQAAIFEWAEYEKRKYPELELLYHVPNGGKRDAKTAAILKRCGVKAGVPDLVLPVARCGYHGLYIELKVGKNRTSKNQDRWLENLNAQGYKAVVCYGFNETTNMILRYLEGEIEHE